MTKVTPRHSLYAFVNMAHFGQKRKYTGEPYFNHVLAVAKAAEHLCKYGYEVGLCHDLLEDTDTTAAQLQDALLRFGYERIDAECITAHVLELTDVWTHEKYPEFNRKQRKYNEAQRLSGISSYAQTVKYCDILDNGKSINSHDAGFAKVYFTEIKYILVNMIYGNKTKYKLCAKMVNNYFGEKVLPV